MGHMQQFFKQRDYNTQGLPYLLLLKNIVGVTVSHPVLRPNRMLIVCVSRNQVYTHIIYKMDT
jgi:hypothetical protein